jgi:hypothetical protein
MKYAIIALLLLSGCSTTVPVVAKFPNVPSELTERCQDLKKLPADAKLSDVTKSVVSNYTLYYECAAKYDAWIEWHNSQKKIFEKVK